MNPLLKHPILKELPYSLIHSPNAEGTKKFLAKKKRQVKWVGYLFALPLLLYVRDIISSNPNELKFYFGIVGVIAGILVMITFQRMATKYQMTDEDITEAIRKKELEGS